MIVSDRFSAPPPPVFAKNPFLRSAPVGPDGACLIPALNGNGLRGYVEDPVLNNERRLLARESPRFECGTHDVGQLVARGGHGRGREVGEGGLGDALTELPLGRHLTSPHPVQAVLDIGRRHRGPLRTTDWCRPGPFRVEAGGRAWTLPANADSARVQALADDGQPLAPALVPVGRIDDRDLLIDLEAAGVTAITGEPGDVEAARWQIAAALATSQWADDLRVVVAGSGHPGFENLERVEVVEPAEVLDHVRGELLATRAELSEHGVRSTIEARARGGSWTPTVVLLGSDDGAHHQELMALERLADSGPH